MFRTILPALALVVLCGCAATPTTPPVLPAAGREAPRNVILVIGDGMGPQQVGLLLQDHLARRANDAHVAPLALATLAGQATLLLSLTDPADGVVVDSACSATQLATGAPAPAEALGIDVTGQAVPTLIERAHATGRATGLVSDTRLTHATPAAFAVHLAHRSQENEAAAALLEARVDVMLSGGLRHFVPPTPHADATWPAQVPATWQTVGRRTDGVDLLHGFSEAGYALTFDSTGLAAASQFPLLGLVAPSGMQDGIQEAIARTDPARTQPTLAEMTAHAVRLLDAAPDGFFLVVEAGQIDWAGHHNDAGRLLFEMERLDHALGELLQFMEGRDDTVLVVTADHETGGFGFSYQALDAWQSTPWSSGAFPTTPYRPSFRFGDPTIFAQLRAQQQSWERLLAQHAALPDPTAGALVALVAQNSSWTITVAQAQAVLTDVPNEWHLADHGYQSEATRPAIHDFPSFYPYHQDARSALLARQLAEQQGVTWSTGTHTATPVPVLVVGAETPLPTLTTHVAVGAWLASLLHP